MKQRHKSLDDFVRGLGFVFLTVGSEVGGRWDLHAPVVAEVVHFEALFDHFDWEVLRGARGSNAWRMLV